MVRNQFGRNSSENQVKTLCLQFFVSGMLHFTMLRQDISLT